MIISHSLVATQKEEYKFKVSQHLLLSLH